MWQGTLVFNELKFSGCNNIFITKDLSVTYQPGECWKATFYKVNNFFLRSSAFGFDLLIRSYPARPSILIFLTHFLRIELIVFSDFFFCLKFSISECKKSLIFVLKAWKWTQDKVFRFFKKLLLIHFAESYLKWKLKQSLNFLRKLMSEKTLVPKIWFKIPWPVC